MVGRLSYSLWSKGNVKCKVYVNPFLALASCNAGYDSRNENVSENDSGGQMMTGHQLS
jgi:hypothetical protein